MSPLLEVRDLQVRFALARESWTPWAPRRFVHAVSDLGFHLDAGETLAIVGESGCGKSSLARALVGLNPIHSGSIRFHGRELAGADRATWHAVRGAIQMVFQDPLSSLDPRMSIGQAIAEPLQAQRPGLAATELRERVRHMAQRVGVPAALLNRYPHEFSGGQCQRVGIARALIVEPALLICDEPVSALDVSIQAQILNLLRELQREEQLAMLFIAHDLAVVRHLADRVLVMYLGRGMEQASGETLFRQPAHPYTQALLRAAPVPDPQRARKRGGQTLAGELPSPVSPPSGCVFRTRCPLAEAACAAAIPAARGDEKAWAACIKAGQIQRVAEPSAP
ncbi:oligopeptide/dipeptide ABC transporter ATP-binding protein [Niveibacterium sp. SC-1]|uniref:oligopeptide/dipeptide ABC transporter ATP-binding protein n=1 Tax=Niveibacterium sp. SC-1 TaxID=3135646 RepID=UPI00311D591E